MFAYFSDVGYYGDHTKHQRSYTVLSFFLAPRERLRHWGATQWNTCIPVLSFFLAPAQWNTCISVLFFFLAPHTVEYVHPGSIFLSGSHTEEYVHLGSVFRSGSPHSGIHASRLAFSGFATYLGPIDLCLDLRRPCKIHRTSRRSELHIKLHQRFALDAPPCKLRLPPAGGGPSLFK
jgi:hypothetical protein